MHAVVMTDWKEESDEMIGSIAETLGITVFEVRQRLIGGRPAVIAGFADPEQAGTLTNQLNSLGIGTFVINTDEVDTRDNYIIVRRFIFNVESLRIETGDRKHAEIPYRNIHVLLPATSIAKYHETKTVKERKFSLGRTLIAGGIPMTKKVERQKEISGATHTKVLYLFVGKRRQPVVFCQDGLLYDGLGSAIQVSQELNFTYLMDELHRRCPNAVYDDRLLRRVGQTRLLGPTLNPETHLDLAAEILAHSLRMVQ